LPDIVGGRTPFDRLTATLRIADGTGKLEATQVESSRVRIDLDGETSVARRNFDLKGTATLLRTEAPADASPPFEIPFLVRGSWDRPFLLPDPTALIQRSGAAAPLLDAARRQAEREKAAAEKARAQNAAAAQAADGAASPAAGFLGDAKR
jgi:AsmA protein